MLTGGASTGSACLRSAGGRAPPNCCAGLPQCVGRTYKAGYLHTRGVSRVPSVLAIGSFTLSPNVTQTVVSAPCTPASVVLISPETPDAANDGPTTSIVPGELTGGPERRLG